MDRVVCIAGKPAPTEKQRQCGARGGTRSTCGSWLACEGIDCVSLIDRGACIAGKPAPTEAKHCGAGGGTRSNCGSGLAREDGGSVSSCVADTPPSRASPLPHLDRSASDKDVLLCCCPAFASTTQVGFQAAVLCF